MCNDNGGILKTERRIRESAEFHNQGHEEYLHKAKHLCGYVTTVLNENLNTVFTIQKYYCRIIDPSKFLLLRVLNVSLPIAGGR